MGKELMRVCRKTAASARRAKVGPGSHKGKPALKVNKGSMECCNDYNKDGVMTKSRCFIKQRPGRSGLGKLTKTGKKAKWRKRMKKKNKKLHGKKLAKLGKRTKKHMKKLKRKTLGRRRRRSRRNKSKGKSRRRRASLVQEALAPTFDVSADHDLENLLAVKRNKKTLRRRRRHSRRRRSRRRRSRRRRSSKKGGKSKGKESHKKPTGHAGGQPAVKGHGMSHIELMKSTPLKKEGKKEGKKLFQFSSEDELAQVLAQ